MGKPKKDNELKKQIKAMEDRQRAESMAAAIEAAPAKAPEMSFEKWWMMLASKITLRPNMKEILWADFKARGLSKNEEAAKYDEALKLFGIKL